MESSSESKRPAQEPQADGLAVPPDSEPGKKIPPEEARADKEAADEALRAHLRRVGAPGDKITEDD